MAKLFSRRIIFALWLTFVGLWAERIMRAAWPLLSTLVLGIGVLLLAAPDLWPLVVLKLAGGIWLLSGLYGLWYFFRRFAAPTLGAARARLDQNLPDRPLAALRDIQALGQGDPASAALWQAHLAQMRAAAAKASAVGPQLDLAPRDPFRPSIYRAFGVCHWRAFRLCAGDAHRAGGCLSADCGRPAMGGLVATACQYPPPGDISQ